MKASAERTLSNLLLAGLIAGCGHQAPYTSVVPTGEPAQEPTVVREALPVTRASVSGRELELVLDLGSVHALTLPREQLIAVGAAPANETVTYTDAVGNRLEAEVFVVPTLRWAGLEWHDVRALEAAWSDEFAPPLRLGVLGRPLFRDHRLVLDLGRERVEVARSRRCGPGAVPISTRWGIVVVMDVGGLEAKALIDTAATHDLAIQPDFAGRRVLTVGAVQLGEVDLVDATSFEIPADVVLGVPFLRAHTIEVDFGEDCLEVIE